MKKTWRSGLAAFFALLLGTCSPVAANLVEGYAVLAPGWDFSDSAAVALYEGDMSIVYVVDPFENYLLSAWNGAMITWSDSNFTELTTAAEDTTVYFTDLFPLLFTTYVIRTAERHYAKFEILSLMPAALIRYAYQPNGSRLLTRGVPTEKTTWGKMKALYAE